MPVFTQHCIGRPSLGNKTRKKMAQISEKNKIYLKMIYLFLKIYIYGLENNYELSSFELNRDTGSRLIFKNQLYSYSNSETQNKQRNF